MKKVVIMYLLTSLLFLGGCDGLKATTHVALQQLPKKEIRISDLFPDDRMAQKMAVAASEGDLEQVDELIAKGANPNAVGEHVITVIGWLLYRPNKAGLKRLFEHGADPNIVWKEWDKSSGWEWSFLHLATKLSPKIGIDYLKMALDMGGNPNLTVKNMYERPIAVAVKPAYLSAFAVLYNAGAKLEYNNIYTSPLMRSCTVSNFELTFFLLEQGVDYMRGAPFDWAKDYAEENEITGPISKLWSTLLYGILHKESTDDMWFWRCVDFLEKKGMDFAIPADIEKLRPAVLSTNPTSYELEIEKQKKQRGDIKAMGSSKQWGQVLSKQWGQVLNYKVFLCFFVSIVKASRNYGYSYTAIGKIFSLHYSRVSVIRIKVGFKIL
ncbi:MAG: hypothetical protein JEY79_19035 [Pseudodesulfovibrio sp.]|nr:hypothetical protein [Pseudodesulfovibrio sp.]